MTGTYIVNEVFYSLQGEGMRAGEASVFVRFARCNQTCTVETHGFDCDTEFESGRRVTAKELMSWIDQECDNAWQRPGAIRAWVVLTGGEPAIQADKQLVDLLHEYGYSVQIETNGSINVDALDLDWITVSPKFAEHTLKQRKAAEVKYVRAAGQGIPKTVVEAGYRLLSPRSTPAGVDPRALAWCIELVKRNPEWRLSVQQHKAWGIR